MDRNRNHSLYRSVNKSLEAEENCRCRLKFGDRAILTNILNVMPALVICTGSLATESRRLFHAAVFF